jgi:hypothetical protein
MMGVGSYFCSAVLRPSSSAVSSNSTWAVGPLGALRFFAFGTGVIRSERRRESISLFVG